MSPMKEASKGAVARVLIAVISSYLGFGLTVAVTEQILSLVTTKGAEKSTAYFAGDVITQCLYLWSRLSLRRNRTLASIRNCNSDGGWSIGGNFFIVYIMEVGATLVRRCFASDIFTMSLGWVGFAWRLS